MALGGDLYRDWRHAFRTEDAQGPRLQHDMMQCKDASDTGLQLLAGLPHPTRKRMAQDGFWLLEGQGKLPPTHSKESQIAVQMGITRPGQEFHRGHVEEQGRLVEATFEEGAGGVERASQDEYHDPSPVALTLFLAFTHAPKQHCQETTIGQQVAP